MSSCAAASRQTSLPPGEAFTYFLTRPFSTAWGGCQRAKKWRLGGHLQADILAGRN